jgi:CxxC motif-containing protein
MEQSNGWKISAMSDEAQKRIDGFGFFKRIIQTPDGTHISIFNNKKEKVERHAAMISATIEMYDALSAVMQSRSNKPLPMEVISKITKALSKANNNSVTGI